MAQFPVPATPHDKNAPRCVKVSQARYIHQDHALAWMPVLPGAGDHGSHPRGTRELPPYTKNPVMPAQNTLYKATFAVYLEAQRRLLPCLNLLPGKQS